MKYSSLLSIKNFVRSLNVVLNAEARCIVNEILEFVFFFFFFFFFQKGSEIIWVYVFDSIILSFNFLGSTCTRSLIMY